MCHYIQLRKEERKGKYRLESCYSGKGLAKLILEEIHVNQVSSYFPVFLRDLNVRKRRTGGKTSKSLLKNIPLSTSTSIATCHRPSLSSRITLTRELASHVIWLPLFHQLPESRLLSSRPFYPLLPSSVPLKDQGKGSIFIVKL